MGVKIVSPKAELAVLRGMTHKDKRIAGLLLSSVDASYFDAQESRELYEALKSHMSKTGESPTFRLMIEDPELGAHAREYFRDSQATITSIDSALKAVRILNRYRQLRGLYELRMSIDTMLQGKTQIDMDEVLDDVSIQVSCIRSSKQAKDSFLHFGKNNSSTALVKDLLFNPDNESTIPTGIAPFDEQSGGVMRGSLVTLGGSSGGGKCGLIDTRIQLATIILETDEFSLECEPEDLVVLTDGGLKLAGDLHEGDDIETCPERVRLQLACEQLCT